MDGSTPIPLALVSGHCGGDGGADAKTDLSESEIRLHKRHGHQFPKISLKKLCCISFLFQWISISAV